MKKSFLTTNEHELTRIHSCPFVFIRGCFLLSFLLLTACAGTTGSVDSYLNSKKVGNNTPAEFSHCRGYGCKFIDRVALTDKDWKDIAKPFKKVDGPITERAAISKAVGILEQKVGAHTGTHVDVTGTYSKLGLYQLDCVDESTNATIYLDLLRQKGLIKHHDIGSAPVTRWPFYRIHFAPHRTATIEDKATGARYAVDGWFHDNGQDAEIVALSTWLHGWSPPAK